VGALLLCFCCAQVRASTQAEDARELLPNAPIERDLQRGESHVYKIALEAGTYLRLAISERGINLQPQLLTPGSEEIGAALYPVVKGIMFVSLVAEGSGSYRLVIRPAANVTSAGRYEVKIEEMRPATEQDRIRVAAEKAEGVGLTMMNSSAERRRQEIAKFEEALALWRQIGEQKAELRVLNSLNIRYRQLGEPQTALEYVRQAIQLARTLGDRYQEANLIMAFGVLYRGLSEYQKALDSLHQARQLFKNLSARYGEAIAAYHIGLTVNRLGDGQNALQYIEESLPVFSSVGDHKAEAFAINAMGSIHRALGDTQKAIELHNRALEIARKSKLMDVEAYSLGHLGNTYFDLGDRQKALDYFEQAVKLCRTLGDPVGEGDGLKMIGDIAYALGDHQKALDFLNQSLGLYRSIWERNREAKALHSLAQVNYTLGNLDEARKQIEQALEIRESLRANLISQQLRETIFSSAQSSFALYIDVLMQLHKNNPTAGHNKAALQASERARARSLLDLLSESQADIRQGVPANLLELERALRQKISSKAAARSALLINRQTQAQAAFFDEEITDLISRYGEVEVQIRQSSPRYAALTQPQPLTPTEIQQQLDENTVLLEFALGEKHSWLWAVTRSSIDSYQLAPGNEIESSARKVYELLTARQPRKGETEDQYKARIKDADIKFQTESALLSRILLGQIGAKLQQEWKGKRLAIVASGALEYIPFAALQVPTVGNPQSSEPLIANYEIINLPSASVLATIRSETAGRKRAEKNLAIIADPVFEANDPRLFNALKKAANNTYITTVRTGNDGATSDVSQTSARGDSDLVRSLKSFNLIHERGGFQRLPFSREEADGIASLTSSNSLMKATDFQANRKIATSGELAHYHMVHFATHGLLNSEHPELSGLVLSLIDEAGKQQDGFLRMQEIYNLQLPADLVVLSACQTALGKEIKGEGLVGLTRGFMYAGAQRVVASLWQVDDLATAELMKRFYSGMLKEGLRPAEALRLAQLKMLKQERWSAPFFWAPFFIQGEWR
jgi:CHAT domain-containing protein